MANLRGRFTTALESGRLRGPILLVCLAAVACLLAGWQLAAWGWAFAVWGLVVILVLLPRIQALPLAGLTEADKWAEADNKARQTIAQILVGFVVLAGAFSAWKQFNGQQRQLEEQHRQFQVQTEHQQRQFDEQRRQFQLQFESQQQQAAAQQKQADAQRRHVELQIKTQQRQLDEQDAQFRKQFDAARDDTAATRFGRAIEQLASDQLEARLGAIGTLERLARLPNTDEWQILEILTAFVRRRAPSPGHLGDDEASEYLNRASILLRGAQNVIQPPPDIQRALYVIANRDWAPPVPPPQRRPDDNEYGYDERLHVYRTMYRINLADSDLRGAVLRNAKLDNADLSRSSLLCADLDGASLRGATLVRTDARFAWFRFAQLTDAVLTKADLTDSALMGANFQRASLEGTKLKGTGAFTGCCWLKNFNGATMDSETEVTTSIRDAVARTTK